MTVGLVLHAKRVESKNSYTPTTDIDIYLYDVSGDSTTPLHGWARVPVDQGSLTTKLYVCDLFGSFQT